MPRIWWNLKVHYHVYKCPPPVPILSQITPVHAPHPTCWRPILILSSHLCLGLPSNLFPSGFPTKTLYAPLLSPIHATCPVSLILDLSTWIIFGEEYRSLNFSICSFLPSYAISTLFPNTPSLHSFLNVNTQVSHPYKTTGKITVLIASRKTEDSALNDSKHSLNLK